MIGEAMDHKGRHIVSKTCEGYAFTVQAAVEIMKRIFSSNYETGFQTRSHVFVLQFDAIIRADQQT